MVEEVEAEDPGISAATRVEEEEQGRGMPSIPGLVPTGQVPGAESDLTEGLQRTKIHYKFLLVLVG